VLWFFKSLSGSRLSAPQLAPHSKSEGPRGDLVPHERERKAGRQTPGPCGAQRKSALTSLISRAFRRKTGVHFFAARARRWWPRLVVAVRKGAAAALLCRRRLAMSGGVAPPQALGLPRLALMDGNSGRR
jgi:hypothetical protein